MTWFNAICRKDNDDQINIAEVDIIAQIGKDWWSDDGIAARDFISAMDALGSVDLIRVRMSTPGGNISDGLAIYNYLRRHPAEVETIALSEVASIGSVIFLAGDRRTVCEGTTVMIHDPLAWAGGYVDLSTCEKLASTLRHYKANIESIYVSRTGQAQDSVSAMMTAETYMTATEAIDNGFAFELDSSLVVNSREASYFETIKEKIALRELPNKETQPRDEFQTIMDHCASIQLPELIPHLATKALTLKEAKAHIATYQNIANACEIAGIPESALPLFNLSGTPAKLIGKVCHALEAKNEADIDPTLTPTRTANKPSLHQTVYEQRRNHTT